MRTESGQIVVVHPGVGASVCLLVGNAPRPTRVVEMTFAEARELSMQLAIAIARQDGTHRMMLAGLLAERDASLGVEAGEGVVVG